MALTENLFIYKDTLVFCKILLKYSKTVSKIVRYSTYNDAVSKACAALDMIRRINESWTERDERIHEYILLMSEVNSRISLLTDAEFSEQETGYKPQSFSGEGIERGIWLAEGRAKAQR